MGVTSGWVEVHMPYRLIPYRMCMDYIHELGIRIVQTYDRIGVGEHFHNRIHSGDPTQPKAKIFLQVIANVSAEMRPQRMT